MKKYGSTVVYFPYTQKVSSTKLREQLEQCAKPTVEAPVQVKIEVAKKASLFDKLAKSMKIKRIVK